MDDRTQVRAALGVRVLWAGPLILLTRAGWPLVAHAVRVWMIDHGLRRAGGVTHSLRVAAGTAKLPLDEAALAALVTRGLAYMTARLGGTITALGIPPMGLRDMVQGRYSELLAGLPAPVAPGVPR
jgi:hypothetical protein